MDNQENIQPVENQERDLMDGGFAVVDREKLIEEETRYITPWYKNFINVFLDPKKMMEDCFYEEPPKGMGIGIAGSMLFSLLYTILTIINPIVKEAEYDKLRMEGIAENLIGQSYIYSKLPLIIGTVIGVFLGALITAVILKIATLIAKDKAKFSVLYTVGLLSSMVSAAMLFIDRIVGYIIPTQNIVLGATAFFPEGLTVSNAVPYTIASEFTIPGIWAIIITIIGYAVATNTSIKKSTIIVLIIQAIGLLIGVISAASLALLTSGVM